MKLEGNGNIGFYGSLKCTHIWENEDMMLLSNPPRQRRRCKVCGEIETVTVGEYREPVMFHASGNTILGIGKVDHANLHVQAGKLIMTYDEVSETISISTPNGTKVYGLKEDK